MNKSYQKDELFHILFDRHFWHGYQFCHDIHEFFFGLAFTTDSSTAGGSFSLFSAAFSSGSALSYNHFKALLLVYRVDYNVFLVRFALLKIVLWFN